VIPVLELALLVAGLALPLALDHFWTVLATRIVLVCLPALSFDLLWGYAGIMSFGQALFYGAAGYSAALLARDLGFTSIFVIVPACVLVSVVLALVMAWFLLLGRYPPSTIFVGLGTLTGAYAADRLARGWYYLGGQNGIPSIPPLTAGSFTIAEGPVYYYLALAVLVIVYVCCRVLVRSQFGLVLAGIRQQEERISFLGYRVPHFKAIVFTLAGGIAGLGGALAAFHDGFVWPNMLGVLLSTQIVLYVLFGGVGTLIGAVIGVASIECVSFLLADRYQTFWPILLGLLLLFVILFRRSGLVGLVVSERERSGRFGRGRARPVVGRGYGTA
jgi:branched-chain amino acid transport system permease protein